MYLLSESCTLRRSGEPKTPGSGVVAGDRTVPEGMGGLWVKQAHQRQWTMSTHRAAKRIGRSREIGGGESFDEVVYHDVWVLRLVVEIILEDADVIVNRLSHLTCICLNNEINRTFLVSRVEIDVPVKGDKVLGYLGPLLRTNRRRGRL